MNYRQALRKWLRRLGYDMNRVTPVSSAAARRKLLFTTYGIDLLLDIGANDGSYGEEIRREMGYAGRIVSFEPLSSAFGKLVQRAGNDPAWSVYNFALGDADTVSEINIAGNSYSSSLLRMLPSHLGAAPESGYVGRETISVKTLDRVLPDICPPKTNIHMKIDTQGYELKVLTGAERSLDRIDTIELEMSLVPLYDGQPLFEEVLGWLGEKGYRLVGVEPCFCDRNTGEVLQVDGIFHRRSGLGPETA